MKSATKNEMGFEVELQATQEAAIERVARALKEEGFGILSRIEIDKAFKEKIGAEFRPYTILGACNPDLAHAALTSKPEIGLMLPCNVTVETVAENQCLVRIVNPDIMTKLGGLGSDDTIKQVAQDASEKLKRVAESLTN